MRGMTRAHAAKAGSASVAIVAFRVAALLAVLWTATPAQAGPVLALDAQARAAVANDEMVVVLAVERDGVQVGPLNDAVLSQLNAAIAEARGVEGVKARLGTVYTQPNSTREGKTQGWRVRGEVVLESTRMVALAQLGARLGERMQLAGVQFRLSSERRQAEEKRLIAEAARAFRTRAADAAAAFGFAGYEIKELALRSGGNPPGPRPMAAMARGGGADVAAAPLPTEGGDSDVVVGVSGSVELKP
jgi:predicted secreted protein